MKFDDDLRELRIEATWLYSPQQRRISLRIHNLMLSTTKELQELRDAARVQHRAVEMVNT